MLKTELSCFSKIILGTTSINDVLIHGGNSAGMLIELLVVRYPIYFAHVIYAVGFGIVYCTFTAVYYFAGGTHSSGAPYIYTILNYSESPGISSLVILGILVLTIFLHVSFCIVQRLRHRLHKKIFASPTSFELKNEQNSV